MLHLLWIVPLVLLVVFLASPRFRGDIAESRTRRLLAQGLERNRYTVFNGLVLPSGGGTVSLDHVVVSRFGIFVIESAYARGWVSGGPFQQYWKQSRLGRLARFDNPMHRNRVQVEALQQLLDYPASVFHPVVVMVGHKGFRTEMPENVLTPERLLAYLRRQARQLLSPDQADRAISTIDKARLHAARGVRIHPLAWIRLALVAVVLIGAGFAFRDDLARLGAQWKASAEQRQAPERFHPDGRPKTEREVWEDSLACAWSVDTGRCACYDPDGARVKLESQRCRELAERGSVLKQ